MTDGYSLTERLAQHLARDVDAAARARARLHLLDWIGCVAGARRSATAAALTGIDAPLLRAAYLGNVLEMDDVHRTALLHPGPVVWPAALGGADARIGDRLEAAVRGYEAMIAAGATFDAHHYAHYHPTATAGVFGAAAAAASGVTGPLGVLEGAQGLYAATCREPRPMAFGDGWRIGEVSFKPWGACRHAHPVIDAALALAATNDLSDTDIEVATYADALAFCDRPGPATVTDAKFSLQHAVAVVVARGVPQLADFEPAAIADPALAALRRRVRVVADPAITARYPAHFGARVTGGGGSVERVDTLGDPERPLDRAGVIAKFAALMAWGGVAGETDAAVAMILDGADDAPVDAVRTLVARIVG